MSQKDTQINHKKCCRPQNQYQEQTFMEVCSYLEANDEEQLTIADLYDKMKKYLSTQILGDL